MLVLTRKVDQAILICPDIRIMVLWLSPDGKRVRLGIEAPPEVHILREELVAKEIHWSPTQAREPEGDD